MPSVTHDVNVALRTVLRRPALSLLCTLTLALGIGAATSIYSVVDGVLLRPLAFPDASRLVSVRQTFPEWRGRDGLSHMWDRMGVSHRQFRDWQSRQRSFESVAAFARSAMTLTGAGAAEQVDVTRVSASALELLRLKPTLGRFFLPGEDETPGARLTVISQELWGTRFGSAHDVIGRTLRLDDATYEIIGVLPKGIDLWHSNSPSPLWIPTGSHPSDQQPQTTDYAIIGRLVDGTSLTQARMETERFFAAHSPTSARGARLTEWQRELVDSARRPLFLLLGAAGILVLLACVNVSTLLLGEVASRAGEFATRAALGARPLQIARQVATECALIAVAGVAVGGTVAVIGTGALVALAPPGMPRLTDVAINGRVFAFASVLGAIVTILAGLAPMIVAARVRSGSMSGVDTARTTPRNEGRTQRILVAIQVALSLVLLVGAGLLGKSLHRLTSVNPGFDVRGLMLVDLGIPGGARASPVVAQALYERVAARVRALGNVRYATIGSAVPFSGSGSSNRFEVRQASSSDTVTVVARRSHVTPGFRETLGIRLLAGRDIREEDRAGSTPVAVVNETMARRYWPGSSAIGERLGSGDDQITVVGVVSDVRHASLADSTRATVYVANAQRPSRYLSLLVRMECSTRGAGCDQRAGMTTIRSIVRDVDPAVPVTRLDAMEDLVLRSMSAERFKATLISAFALMATLLAAIGIVGATTRAVGRQRREIAIRLAIGSTPHRITALFVRRIASAAGIGILVGMGIAVEASRFLTPFLFEVASTDPLTYVSCAGALGFVALVASWIPARRATNVHPSTVLRDAATR